MADPQPRRRPRMVRNADGTTVFVEDLPEGQNPPALPQGEAAPTQEEMDQRAADAARTAQENAPPQDPMVPSTTITNPNGKPVTVEAGQGPVGNEAFSQGLGLPNGLLPDEPTTILEQTGSSPSLGGLTPPVPPPTDIRASITEFLSQRGFGATQTPSGVPRVRQGAGGAPTVEAPTEPRPPLTEEQRKQLSREEQAAWDDPGVDDEHMIALMEKAGRGIGSMGLTTQSAKEEEAAARSAHEQQLNDSAAEIRQTMQDTIERTQRMQDDMQSRVDSLYAETFDPRRIFSSPDAAASFSLHTGYAMGAMIQSLQATNFPGSNPVNVASRVIDGVIEADIARQRESFRRGEGEIRQGFAAIEAQRRLGVSEVDALQFSRAAAEEEVAQQLARIAAQYQGTHAGEVAAHVERQYRLAAMGRRRALNATAMALASQQAMRPTGRGRAATPEVDAWIGPDTWVPIPAENRTARQEANYQFYVGNNAIQLEMARAGQGAGEAIRTADNIISLLDASGNGIFNLSPRTRADLKSLATALTGQIKSAEQLGALDNGVLEFVRDLIGQQDGFIRLTDMNDQSIRRFRHHALGVARRKAQQMGFAFSESALIQEQQSTEDISVNGRETGTGSGAGAVRQARSSESDAQGLPPSPATTSGTVMDTVARTQGRNAVSILNALFGPDDAPEPETDDDSPTTIGDLFGS